MNKMTQATAREFWNYNPGTGVLTWRKVRSKRLKVGQGAGCLHKTKDGKTYRRVGFGYGKLMAHHIIWCWMTGHFPKGTEGIDHEDGNGCNNRWNNLRLVSGAAEQNKNVRLPKHNTSGAVGVRFNKRLGKYIAQIGINGWNYHLGCFTRLDDAISAREAASKAHGFHPNHGQSRPL